MDITPEKAGKTEWEDDDESEDDLRRTADVTPAEEVWLVTPYPWLVEVLLLDGASYRIAGTYTRTDELESPTFSDLRVALDRVFDFPLEPGEEIGMVKEGHPPHAAKNPSGK